MELHRDVRILVACRAVDPEADPRSRPNEVRDATDAGSETQVARRTVRHAGTGRCDAPNFLVVEMNPVCKPDVVAGPAEALHQLERAFAKSLEAEMLLILRLRDMGVQPHSVPAGRKR